MNIVPILDNLDIISSFRDDLLNRQEQEKINLDVIKTIDKLIIEMVFKIEDLLDDEVQYLKKEELKTDLSLIENLEGSAAFLNSYFCLNDLDFSLISKEEKIMVRRKISNIIIARFA